MSIRYSSKTFSQANASTTGTSTLMFGPIPVDWLDNFAFHIKNCSTVTINYSVRASADEARNIESVFPLGSFTNTQAVAASAGGTVIRTLYGDANPFKYISVVGSATAAIASSLTFLVLTGRGMK